MALLQVRNFPDSTYQAVSRMAREERRTVAQQTILLVEAGLAAGGQRKELRRQAIERTLARTVPESVADVDVVALVREDRDR